MDSGIAPLELTELPADLQARLKPRVERLGYLGDFFRYCGHQPAPLLHFYEFTESLKAALPDDITETVALTVASRTGNDYERVQHERLSHRLGFADEWIAGLVGAAEAPDGLTGEQADARELALAVLASDWDRAATHLSALTRRVGQRDAMGILMLVGRYLAHSAVSNTLHLTAPGSATPSPHGMRGPK